MYIKTSTNDDSYLQETFIQKHFVMTIFKQKRNTSVGTFTLRPIFILMNTLQSYVIFGSLFHVSRSISIIKF